MKLGGESGGGWEMGRIEGEGGWINSYVNTKQNNLK